MARPKKIVETKDEIIETEVDEKTEVELALEAKDKEMQEMKIQMEMLMKQMAQMATMNQGVQVGKANDIEVAIGCRALNGACLANKSGDIDYNI